MNHMKNVSPSLSLYSTFRFLFHSIIHIITVIAIGEIIVWIIKHISINILSPYLYNTFAYSYTSLTSYCTNFSHIGYIATLKLFGQLLQGHINTDMIIAFFLNLLLVSFLPTVLGVAEAHCAYYKKRVSHISCAKIGYLFGWILLYTLAVTIVYFTILLLTIGIVQLIVLYADNPYIDRIAPVSLGIMVSIPTFVLFRFLGLRVLASIIYYEKEISFIRSLQYSAVLLNNRLVQFFVYQFLAVGTYTLLFFAGTAGVQYALKTFFDVAWSPHIPIFSLISLFSLYSVYKQLESMLPSDNHV